MNPLHNNLKYLQIENENDMEGIASDKNKDELIRMIQYLTASSLSIFQIEVIRKDLIGLALEADKEKLSLSEKLGINPKDFCDDIIQNNAEYPSLREHVLQESVSVLQFTAVFYALEFFTHAAPRQWGISAQLLCIVIIYFTITRILTSYIRNKFSLHRKPYMRGIFLITAILGLAAYILITKTFFEDKNLFIISGNGWGILIVLVIISVFATFARNGYWNYCSRKYSY
ncbi:MAG: hypothetical protein Q4D16_19990 [Eubacteriales bacterium]|nr:hypothetical protein [Eubacteriales bacterium]